MRLHRRLSTYLALCHALLAPAAWAGLESNSPSTPAIQPGATGTVGTQPAVYREVAAGMAGAFGQELFGAAVSSVKSDDTYLARLMCDRWGWLYLSTHGPEPAGSYHQGVGAGYTIRLYVDSTAGYSPTHSVEITRAAAHVADATVFNTRVADASGWPSIQVDIDADEDWTEQIRTGDLIDHPSAADQVIRRVFTVGDTANIGGSDAPRYQHVRRVASGLCPAGIRARLMVGWKPYGVAPVLASHMRPGATQQVHVDADFDFDTEGGAELVSLDPAHLFTMSGTAHNTKRDTFLTPAGACAASTGSCSNGDGTADACNVDPAPVCGKSSLDWNWIAVNFDPCCYSESVACAGGAVCPVAEFEVQPNEPAATATRLDYVPLRLEAGDEVLDFLAHGLHERVRAFECNPDDIAQGPTCPAGGGEDGSNGLFVRFADMLNPRIVNHYIWTPQHRGLECDLILRILEVLDGFNRGSGDATPLHLAHSGGVAAVIPKGAGICPELKGHKLWRGELGRAMRDFSPP